MDKGTRILAEVTGFVFIILIVILIATHGMINKVEAKNKVLNKSSGEVVENNVVNEPSVEVASNNVVENVNTADSNSNNKNKLNSFINTNTNLDNSGTIASNIDQKDLARAREILYEMTLDEKVSQMFFIKADPNNKNDIFAINNVGGLLLFGDNVKNEDKESLKKKINAWQAKNKYKMFIGVDEEGGTVNRISSYKQYRDSRYRSAQTLYKKGGFDLIREETIDKCNLLKELKINMNLAPVCDYPKSKSSFIYKRSFQGDLNEISEYVKNEVDTYNKENIVSCLKHFPGYGDNSDTHKVQSVGNRTLEEFKERDFKPFEAGIKADVPFVLMNHNIENSIDVRPCSISKKAHDILENDLGFKGITITDDLKMDGIKKYANDNNLNLAVEAIKAKNDMIITTDYVADKEEIIKEIQNSNISINQIDNSVLKILLCKLKFKIIT